MMLLEIEIIFKDVKKLYKLIEFGVEFYWNEKLDDCFFVNFLNIDWFVR